MLKMDALTKRLGSFQDQMSGINITAAANDTSSLLDTIIASASSTSPLLHLVLYVYRLLGLQTGVDPSALLSLLGLLWAGQYACSYTWRWIDDFVDRNLMCSISISENDNIYYHILQWLSQQPSLRKNRYLTAQTIWKSAWDEDDEEEENGGANLTWTEAGSDGEQHRYLNFSSLAARSCPRFVPAMGSTKFWHRGMYFRIYRRKETLMNTSGWGGAMKDLEELKIYCFGRSMNPIKNLLAEAKALYYQDTHQRTTIYRPRNKEQRRDYSMWNQVARRPVRPMQTVVLDSKEKHAVLADINEYLHPGTPRWYASRGIPLRRGYLFHGPPGTGKTSFSFAIAGVFGIDIYVISLQDANISEEDLATLFTRLPRRCIVLLEDIDTAGLRRDDEDEESQATEDTEALTTTEGKTEDENKKEKNKKKTGKEKKKDRARGKKRKDEDDGGSENNDSDMSESSSDISSSSSSSDDDLRKKRKKRRKRSGKRDKRGKLLPPESISLSGLLNAIDGVASHEGRVLIMTTNKPESLDEALVRPGRVDMQVGFPNASSSQAEELFHRMYEGTPRQQAVTQSHMNGRPTINGSAKASRGASERAKKGMVLNVPSREGDEPPASPEELKGIAAEFGQLVPEQMFSPAEIQGFLLKRKRSPRKALADAKGWIEAAIEQKENKSKIATVQ